MAALQADPFEAGGIAGFGADLRAGRTSARAAARACLDRIEALDGRLSAFQHVAGEQAMAAAGAVDALLAAGTDLGPLMGVPVGIKDIAAVDGMPTTNGSLYESADITGPEGRYVRGLKQAGCVILGKTRTVEFALGAAGVNTVRGTPWNPWDAATHRFPGGSSSGSGVAVAAGLCGFALGSDTGGSIRVPAAFNGLFGHKTTIGLLPTDGVFPLCPTLDTLGPLCRTAEDAAAVHGVTAGVATARPAALDRLRFGRPRNYFFEEIDGDVLACVEAAIERLRAAGAEVVDIEVPDPSERDWMFPAICPPEMIAAFGVERFRIARQRMDPTVGARAEAALRLSAHDHARALNRHRELRAIVAEAMRGFDGWLAPTVPFVAQPVAALSDERALARSFLASRNSQPGNLWGLCAISVPVHRFGSPLPVGLQVMCAAGRDSHALAIGQAIDSLFGPPLRPDLSGFH